MSDRDVVQVLDQLEVLLERIADREKPFPTEIVMTPQLLVRESTGTVRKP